MHAEDGRLDDRRAARPVLQRHRPGRLRAHGQAEVGRHGPVHHPELHARPAERAQRATRTTGAPGQPYFDQVTVIDFADPTAQVNALLSGADRRDDGHPVRADRRPPRATATSRSSSRHGGGWLPLCMAVDMPPFDNVNVRQAMRLIVDRPAMLAQVLSGHGRVANDLYAPFDADYDTGAAAAPSGHRPGQVAAQGGRHGEPDGRPAHDGRRGRHGRLGQRLRLAGEGRRRDDQRQERPELLRRPVPQAGVLGRLLGHAQLPAAGRARQHPGRAPTTRRHWGPIRRARSTSASTSRPSRRRTPPSATSS